MKPAVKGKYSTLPLPSFPPPPPKKKTTTISTMYM